MSSFIENNFSYIFLQDFRLAETKIYSRAGRRLALIKKYSEIKQLLKCHKNTGLANKESCDEILDACVRALAGDKTQIKGAEELVKHMQSDTSKVSLLHWGYYLETDQDPIAVGIRVELFIHEPCRQKTPITKSCMSNHAVPICINLVSLGLWVNSSTLITMAIGSGSVSRSSPLV